MKSYHFLRRHLVSFSCMQALLLQRRNGVCGETVPESQDWFCSCKNKISRFCFYPTCEEVHCWLKSPRPLIFSTSGENELWRCPLCVENNMRLKPKMSPVSGQGRKPCPVWTDPAQSQAAPASRFVLPRALFLPTTHDRWTFATWPMQLRRFILNNFNPVLVSMNGRNLHVFNNLGNESAFLFVNFMKST